MKKKIKGYTRKDTGTKVKSYQRTKTPIRTTRNEIYVQYFNALLKNSRRSFTTSEISKKTGSHPNTIEKYLTYLKRKGKITYEKKGKRKYWKG